MPRRSRRRAWGSIDSVIPNKKYVLRWMENTPEGRRRRCETFYGTYREADLRLAKIRVERAADKPVPTIGEAYKTWYLPELERRVSDGEASKNTLSQYTHIWKKVIEPRWSRVPVDSTRALDIQEWLLTLSRGNANQAIRILRKIMDVCVRYELAESNKFREVFDMPKKQSRPKRRSSCRVSARVARVSRLASRWPSLSAGRLTGSFSRSPRLRAKWKGRETSRPARSRPKAASARSSSLPPTRSACWRSPTKDERRASSG